MMNLMKLFEMKRIVSCLFAFTIALGAMAQESENDPKVWPWDFPQAVKISGQTGQLALSCYSAYFDLVEKGEGFDNKVMIFYKTTIEKVGKEKTLVSDFHKDTEVPNALVIPLDKTAKAKKGDVVLTWWQTGSGMQRAIVVDDTNPTEPVVCYLDQNWPDNPDASKVAEKQKGEPLKPGTFNVVKGGKWEPGEQVAYHDKGEWCYGRLVHTDGDKVLLSVFASYLVSTTKDRCKLIPFKEKIKVGDKVSGIFVRYYRPGFTVVKVDNDHGRVWVKKDGSDRTQCFSIAEVTKVLE